MTEQPLEGRTIAVAESRELDVFVAMLERRGARVLRCPLVGIVDAPEPAPVLEWIAWFNSGACDDFIVLTGRACADCCHASSAMRPRCAVIFSASWRGCARSPAARNRRAPCASSA